MCNIIKWTRVVLNEFWSCSSSQHGCFNIVDIGGGFPGDSKGYGGPGMPTSQELAATIRKGISHFMIILDRLEASVYFIAKPGRFFASACTTIAKVGSNPFVRLIG